MIAPLQEKLDPIEIVSNRVFDNYDAIIDAPCEACRKLIAQPETITSVGMRHWAHVGQES